MSNELDKHIGETLGRYESNVDAEALWEAVKPPKRRMPWLWFLALFGAVAIAGGLWLWSDDGSETVVDSQQVVSNATVANEEGNTSDETYQETANQAASGLEPQDDMLLADKVPMSVLATKNTTSSLTSVAKNTTVGDTEIQVTEEAVNTNLVVANEKPEQDTRVLGNITNEASSGNTIDEDNAEDRTAEAVTEDASVTVSNNPVFTKAVQNIGTLAYEVSLTEGEEELPIITLGDLPSRNRKASPFFAQVDVAYLGVQRQLENKDSLGVSWVSKRVNSEEVLEGLSADVSFGYRSPDGWQVRGGLGYTQLNTLFESTAVTQTVDTVTGVTMLIYGPGNSVDSVLGPVAYYETQTRERKTYNSIRQWELPLLGGYNFELGRLTLLAEAGVRLRLQRSWEGTVLNQSLENEFQDLSTTDWYRTGLGVSLQGGLQLAYPITSQLDILAGGSVRYNLQDFSAEESPFTERYQLLGGQLGLRYRF
ncbi:hypothetical protein [Lewinella cohaerens]|uniref:hypothetical protein n=1 Tax=Lewinella cohaerens TaxID=70995 RepID=UPI00037AEE03|nr:hypothetical protein [Lewinella cohaerens]